jgi:hypothetical protein
VVQKLTLNGVDVHRQHHDRVFPSGTNGNVYEGATAIGMIVQATTTNMTLNVQVQRNLGSASWTVDANSAGSYVNRTRDNNRQNSRR